MKVTVEGTIEEMDKAKEKFFELLKTLQKEKFLNEMKKQLSERVQWEGMVRKFHLIFSLNKHYWGFILRRLGWVTYLKMVSNRIS